jgi:hypothetical protein
MKAISHPVPFTLLLIVLTVISFSKPASATLPELAVPLASSSINICRSNFNTGLGAHWLADFSPFTSSPSIADVPADGQCVRGRFECRWGGDCVKVDEKCYNCIEDYRWSSGMETCYSCGEGQNLVETPNGEWRCQS